MFKIVSDGFILAIQLLTTVPIKKEVQWDDRRAKASVALYPVVGLILGLLLAGQGYVLLTWTSLSPLVISAWLLTFSLLYSGGLHLDGWADFHDAVFSRRDQETKLKIMQDPQVGTFAVLAVIMLLSWRFIFIYELIAQMDKKIIFALVLIPIISRLLLGWQLLLGTFAKEKGMAVALQAARKKDMKWIYIIWTLFLVVITNLFFPLYLILIVSAIIFLFIWIRWVHYQLSGMTGDTLGAGAEGGETILWGMLWILLLFGMV